MNLVDNNSFNVLQRYVGKVFYHDYNQIEILSLFGCEAGPPFFLCRMSWSDFVYCADPLEVVTMFDDDLQPFDEYNVAQLL